MKDIEQLILENEKLIYSAINYFNFYPYKEDLYQAGTLGMIKAYKTYDPAFNTKFTTHAYLYILGEMKKEINYDKGIKINRKLQMLSLKIEKASIFLMQSLMREPTIKELAHYLNEDYELVELALQIPKQIMSTNEPLKEDSKEICLEDIVGIDDKNKDDLIELKKALNLLSEDERKIIESRYVCGYTQQEIADMIGISQVQVYRSEQKILKKMKEIIA